MAETCGKSAVRLYNKFFKFNFVWTKMWYWCLKNHHVSPHCFFNSQKYLILMLPYLSGYYRNYVQATTFLLIKHHTHSQVTMATPMHARNHGNNTTLSQHVFHSNAFVYPNNIKNTIKASLFFLNVVPIFPLNHLQVFKITFYLSQFRQNKDTFLILLQFWTKYHKCFISFSQSQNIHSTFYVENISILMAITCINGFWIFKNTIRSTVQIKMFSSKLFWSILAKISWGATSAGHICAKNTINLRPNFDKTGIIT